MISPKVAILLPIYKPNMDWLVKQIVSVNEQTYGNMEFFVYLDDPEDATDYAAVLHEHITKMPFILQKREKNLGSNKAFEKLTYMAKEKGGFKYIAFCDQDDIWLPEKIAALVNEAEKNDMDLVCSDMEVINENDEMEFDKLNNQAYVQIVDKKYIVENVICDYLRKENVFDTLMQFNLFTGCSMLVSTRVAYEALPFSKYEWYDHWVALYVAGTSKKIGYFCKPLLKRRFHKNNQTMGFANNDKNKDKTVEAKTERINFLDDLKIALQDKMSIVDAWMLNRAYFQFIGEIYLMQKQAEEESYKII